ncbi:phage baseplate assembly protein V [Sutterella sp.]|uniref:phage baseplate assembly protein V n=1 Tax=Sutterella sp. TaxID=1981025 RepID=UPI0026DF43C8|nr:phage baseplate assembly protein V [Sutterella sp.]MDO5531429.1 phage baseplate assembly protein V [Sutterella sp.]
MGRLDDIAARGTVSAADGAKKLRVLQVRLLYDEVRDHLEHIEPYGWTAEPKDDGKPEAFVIFPAGDRSHGWVFSVVDRRYRPKGLEPGEVEIYDDQGQYIKLARDGIEVVTPKKLTATIGESLTATVGAGATVNVTGSVSVTASESATITSPTVAIDAKATTVTGTLTVEGLIAGKGGMTITGGSGGSAATVTGTLTVVDGDVTASGISLMTHVHDGVQGGDSTTGQPQ